MDANPQPFITGSQILGGLATLALMGWNLFLSAEKKSLEKDIGVAKENCDKLTSKVEIMEKAYFTRAEQKEFRAEIILLLDKMSTTFSASLDKLADRLEKFMDEEREGRRRSKEG